MRVVGVRLLAACVRESVDCVLAVGHEWAAAARLAFEVTAIRPGVGAWIGCEHMRTMQVERYEEEQLTFTYPFDERRALDGDGAGSDGADDGPEFNHCGRRLVENEVCAQSVRRSLLVAIPRAYLGKEGLTVGRGCQTSVLWTGIYAKSELLPAAALDHILSETWRQSVIIDVM